MPFGFFEFVDSKERKARKHLGIVKTMLEKGGFRVVDKLEERKDPHIFVFNPDSNLSFDGIRIYEIGGQIAYRIQKEAHTHPFGKAYALPIEKMYDDMLGEDDMKDEQVGKEIVKAVLSEIKDFFERSYDAEHKSTNRFDPLGSVHMRAQTGATDYVNTGTGTTGQ